MPQLALTIGDPTSIGPEITAKALQHLPAFPDLSLTVIGSITALENAAKALTLSLPTHGNIMYQAIEGDAPGAIAYQSIEKAIALIAAGDADALVTGPISKRNLIAAGYNYPGHTEILQELAQGYYGLKACRAEMLFIYKDLRLMLLTRHVPLRDVPKLIAQREKMEEAFSILINFLRQKTKGDKPHLAVLGVNPHAGEIGGKEEVDILQPIMQQLVTTNLATCDGPLAADGFFRHFDPAHNRYDAIVAAYHDQGLIPFKMLAGYEAVNVTIGLPFLRTSVSHGTAEDIVGRGIADERSMLAAIQAALEILGASGADSR